MTLKTYQILRKTEDLKLNKLFDQEVQSTILWSFQEVNNNNFEINVDFWYIEIKIAYFQFFDEVSFMLLKEFNNAADDHHIIRTLLILKIKHVMSSTERFLSCIGVKQGARNVNR